MHNGIKKLCYLSLCATFLDCYAFNFTLEPSIAVQETYSDNINLADKGLEDDDFVTSLSPGITIKSDSRFHESRSDYVLQKINHVNRGQTQTFNSLNTEGEFEFLKDHFFTDYSVRNGQQNISNSGVLSSDNLSINNNRQNVLSYRVHPNWRQRFSVYAFLEAGVNYDEIISEKNNSTSETISLRLQNGTIFNQLLWDVDYTDKTIENESGSETIFRNVTGNVRYLVTRKIAVITSVGFDDNQFQSTDTISGLSWNAGIEWNPSRRTSALAAFGKRFFGTDLKLDFSHRTKKTRFKINYDQTPDVTRNTLLNQQVFSLVDIFGDAIIDPQTGLPATLDVLIPEQTTEVLINRKLTILASYDYRKTFLSLKLTAEQREFQLTDDKEDTYGSQLTWIWELSPTLNTNTRFNYLIQDSRQGIKNEQVSLSLNVIKNLTREIDINAGLGHTIRDVDSGQGSYKETRAFIGLSKVF